MKKGLIITGVIIIVGMTAFYFRSDIRSLVSGLNRYQLPTEVRNISGAPIAATSSKFIGINLAVPFSSQAPYGDWGLPYMEACEETSAILVDSFYQNKQLTPEIVKQEILKIVDWENKTFGYYKNTNAAETARILKEYFSYKRVDVDYDISLEDIKSQIISGRPVIVPLDGRLINNPFYRQPGPIYHMLVIKGLTKDGSFITNDVGTKRGYDYVYDANTLYNAIHDAPVNASQLSDVEFTAAIISGRKVMIIVYPN